MKPVNSTFLNKKFPVIIVALICTFTFFAPINKANAQCTVPAFYNVTGGGAFCAGDSGVQVGLDNSEAGVSYQLIQDGNETGAAVEGNGAAISFGNQTAAGTYSVVATVDGEDCQWYMDGEAIVTVNQSPVIKLSTSGPTTFCSGGTVTLSVPDAGNALQFDGVDDYVSILNPVDQVFTIEAWIKTSANSLSGTYAFQGNGIIWADVGGGANDFTIAILNNRLSFFDGAGNIATNGSIILNDGVWHHIAVVRNGVNNTTSLFVDGVPDGSNFAQNIALNANPTIAIGANTLDKRYFNGAIDEVRIWSYAKTQSEILATMHTTVRGNSPGLLAYYKFDETSDTIAADATGNGNDGTLQNGPTMITSNSLTANYSSYLWSNGDTTSSTNATASGNYTVSITDNHGCRATSDETVVTVNALPATPTITAAGPVSFCKGGSVKLTSDASFGNQWYKDGVIIPGAITRKNIASGSGTYTVIVTDSTGCISDTSMSVVVTENPLPPKPVITMDMGTFCSGGKATLSCKKDATSYQWYKDGSLISGATNKSYKTKIAGSYTVTVFNESGCQVVSNPAVLSCSSAATAANTIVGQLTVKVLPNPSINDFTLQLQSGDNITLATIKVADSYGRIVYETRGTANESYTFGQRFLPGIYFVQVLQGNTVKTIKIVKEK